MKIAITGANSSVGKILIKQLLAEDDMEVVAGARSDNALSELPQSPRLQGAKVDYQQPESLEAALAGCDCVVHLAGILIENKHSNYATANVAATAAVLDAARAASVPRVVFVSVVNADPKAKNAYLRSKGAAEELVKASGLAGGILRTPMLLGPGSAGAASLVGTASRPQAKVLGGGHYTMRPLDIDDLSRAIIALSRQTEQQVASYDLVGPQSIAYRDLIARTAKLMGRNIEISPVPIWTAKLGAAINCTLKGGGISPTVIDVITSSEDVAENSDQALDIKLTSLDDTLNKIISAH